MSNFAAILFLIGALVAFFAACYGLWWAFVWSTRLVFLAFGIKRPVVTGLIRHSDMALTAADKQSNAYEYRKAWAKFFFKEALRARKRERAG